MKFQFFYMTLVRTLVLPRRYLFGIFEVPVLKKVPFGIFSNFF